MKKKKINVGLKNIEKHKDTYTHNTKPLRQKDFIKIKLKYFLVNYNIV